MKAIIALIASLCLFLSGCAQLPEQALRNEFGNTGQISNHAPSGSEPVNSQTSVSPPNSEPSAQPGPPESSLTPSAPSSQAVPASSSRQQADNPPSPQSRQASAPPPESSQSPPAQSGSVPESPPSSEDTAPSVSTEASRQPEQSGQDEGHEKPYDNTVASKPDDSSVFEEYYMPAAEERILELTNLTRKSLGLTELTFSPELKKAARMRSREMFLGSYFDHCRPDGTEWYTILDEIGLPRCHASENIAKGTFRGPKGESGNILLPEFWQEQWEQSLSHYESIIDPDVTRIGVGFYYVVTGDYVAVYTTVIFAEI